MPLPTDKLPVPHGYLTAIGWVAVNFSRMDFFVVFAITRLSDLHLDRGLVIGDEVRSTRIRLRILKALVEQRMPECKDKATFLDLIKTMNRLNGTRNQYTHHIWGVYEDDPERVFNMKIKPASQTTFPPPDITIEEIELFAREIGSAADALMELLATWSFPTRALRHTPPKPDSPSN